MNQKEQMISVVEDYLSDAGFDKFLYIIIQSDNENEIEVDFDDEEAVKYLISDIEKTNYRELFRISYRRQFQTKRHTAVFKILNV